MLSSYLLPLIAHTTVKTAARHEDTTRRVCKIALRGLAACTGSPKNAQHFLGCPATARRDPRSGSGTSFAHAVGRERAVAHPTPRLLRCISARARGVRARKRG